MTLLIFIKQISLFGSILICSLVYSFPPNAPRKEENAYSRANREVKVVTHGYIVC